MKAFFSKIFRLRRTVLIKCNKVINSTFLFKISTKKMSKIPPKNEYNIFQEFCWHFRPLFARFQISKFLKSFLKTHNYLRHKIENVLKNFEISKKLHFSIFQKLGVCQFSSFSKSFIFSKISGLPILPKFLSFPFFFENLGNFENSNFLDFENSWFS